MLYHFMNMIKKVFWQVYTRILIFQNNNSEKSFMTSLRIFPPSLHFPDRDCLITCSILIILKNQFLPLSISSFDYLKGLKYLRCFFLLTFTKGNLEFWRNKEKLPILLSLIEAINEEKIFIANMFAMRGLKQHKIKRWIQTTRKRPYWKK